MRRAISFQRPRASICFFSSSLLVGLAINSFEKIRSTLASLSLIFLANHLAFRTRPAFATPPTHLWIKYIWYKIYFHFNNKYTTRYQKNKRAKRMKYLFCVMTEMCGHRGCIEEMYLSDTPHSPFSTIVLGIFRSFWMRIFGENVFISRSVFL